MNEKSKMPKSLVEEMDDVLTFKHLDIDSFDKWFIEMDNPFATCMKYGKFSDRRFIFDFGTI